MAFNFNGTSIGGVKFNSTTLDKLIYNGVTVWENWELINSSYDIGTGTVSTNGGSGYLYMTGSVLSKPIRPVTFNVKAGDSNGADVVTQKVIFEGKTANGTWITIGEWNIGDIDQDGWGYSRTIPSAYANTEFYQFRAGIQKRSDLIVTIYFARITSYYQKG